MSDDKPRRIRVEDRRRARSGSADDAVRRGRGAPREGGAAPSGSPAPSEERSLEGEEAAPVEEASSAGAPYSDDLAAEASPSASAPASEPFAPADIASGDAASQEATAQGDVASDVAPEAEPEHDYLADLQRLQAEFDNYRKRMVREQTAMAQRAGARLVERLLPVLDNLDKAIDHGEAGAGIEITYKELWKILAEEGLEEIAAEGLPFDPRVHEAFAAVEDDSVDEPMVRSVWRRGYRLKDRVIRPAMVQVARPPEEPSPAGAEGDEGPDAAEG